MTPAFSFRARSPTPHPGMSLTSLFASEEAPIMGARYISAIALTCLLYDHLTHIDNELTDIWFNLKERTLLKVMFLCGRYATEVFVAYSAAVKQWEGSIFSLFSNCQAFTIASIFLFNLSVIGTEAVVIYRIRSLWDHNRQITYAIATMFLLVILTMIISTAFEVVHLPKYIVVIPGFPECLFLVSDSKPIPYMLLEATILIVWDIFNIIIFASNAFSKPYQCSNDVLARFKRDGGRYFLYLLAVRSLHLFVTAFGKNSRFSTIPLASALAVIINARIFHRIGRDFEAKRDALPQPRSHWVYPDGGLVREPRQSKWW